MNRTIATVLVTVLISNWVFADSPLEDYVRSPDDTYRWDLVETQEFDTHRVILVNMVSQHWLTAEDVDRTEWRHWLVITVPKNLEAGSSLLYISGGSNNGIYPDAHDTTAQIATFTKSVVAELRMVPNQPLIFHDDGVRRREDNLIAYAWVQYLETNDPRWLPRGPMVKAAVRAMDTVSSVMGRKEQGSIEINEFVVAGGSKRGWTTWLTGAFDDRVIAIAPIVIDVLNVQESMKHQFEAYGFWSPSIVDYVNQGLMKEWENPKLTELYRLVDPYSYLGQTRMPKLVLNATGDQFFLPDSSQFYWDELKGPKYLRYVPNGEHSLRGTDGIETLSVFFAMVKNDTRFPEYSWDITSTNLLTVTSKDQPKSVQLWRAHNPHARDFRVSSIGQAYSSTEIEAKSGGQYEVQLNEPTVGWAANLLELTFDVGLAKPLKLSTPVYVLPRELPFVEKERDRDTSITLVCRGDEAQYRNLIDLSSSVAKDNDFEIDHLQKDGQLYLNWERAKNLGDRYRLIEAAFVDKGCEFPMLQLESGPNFTLPPIGTTRANP